MKWSRWFTFITHARWIKKFKKFFSKKPRKSHFYNKCRVRFKHASYYIRRKYYRVRHPFYPKDVKSAMAHINTIRRRRGLKPLQLDKRAHVIARARLRDMRKYHYFGHNNPRTGYGAHSLKNEYGFADNEGLSENIYSGGNLHNAVRAWMKSPGHRENLMGRCVAAAVASDRKNSVFIGVLQAPKDWTFC